MNHDAIRTVCTASFINDFPYGSYAAACESRVTKSIEDAIKAALLNRKCIIQAYTTAQQPGASKCLEAAGFKVVMDAVNYKYPGSSKRLLLWALDLNTRKDQKVEVKAASNPFAQAPVQEVPVQPQTPPRLRLQNGQFMPGRGGSFTVDVRQPLPPSWENSDVIVQGGNHPATYYLRHIYRERAGLAQRVAPLTTLTLHRI